jgi:type II secretory pathway component GspD/PulD (secretin)
MISRFLTLLLFVTLLPHEALAQGPPPPSPPPPATNVTALMVEITISRYQGDKRISSLPYTIAVTPDSKQSNLRMGGSVPIPSTTFTPSKEGDAKAPLTSYTYRDIGTGFDVSAAPAAEGRYRISISIDESSVYPPGEAGKNDVLARDAPAFRSLRSNNTLLLRNGQSVEYTAATDRITGETARISVKLTVVN